MTGLDLTERIRRLYPQIPVILCTGYSDRLNYDIAREAGAVIFDENGRSAGNERGGAICPGNEPLMLRRIFLH